MRDKAVIFDLDGVIVDTARFHFLAWQEIARELGIPFTETENEKLKGVSREKSLDYILDLGNTSLSGERKKQLLTKKNELYLDYISRLNESDLLPGIRELLDFLQATAIPVAVASSSRNARMVLDKLNLTGRFDALLTGNDIIHTKPHPEIFLKAAEALQIKPGRCVVVEDAPAGIEAARRAGMKTIGVGHPAELKHAGTVVASPAGLLPVIKKMLDL